MKLEELAKLAGVSRTTASYVLNGKAKEYRVSDRTIERVQALIDKYDFKPNAMAAGLRVGRSHTIGMIIPDFANISYAQIANLLENHCREKGYQLLITCSNDKAHNEMECAKHLFQRQVDALIVSTCLPMENDFYLTHQDVPVIGFDRRLHTEGVKNLLANDVRDACHLGVNLLERQPYKKVLFFGAVPELVVSKEREMGFREALQNTNTDIKDVHFLYADEFKKDSAAVTFEAWLECHGLPDAIYTTSLTLLQGVLEIFLKKQKSIPENVVFATFGKSELVDLLANPVVCSVQNHRAIAQALFELAIPNKKAKTVVMPEKLIRQIYHYRW
ncbi:catabolite repressor/activator [Actinobacillus porcinus]|uniref:catabolite repressor/activator n=1 Tax=Actinobacillus porcinus TaxID=51048 RepID=UPI0023578A10|nr:catabolite repressor/activator [Actinobacillus porcinus]MDY6215836.1 catabolite repressor/activator [Actinobacillus porcinus]